MFILMVRFVLGLAFLVLLSGCLGPSGEVSSTTLAVVPTTTVKKVSQEALDFKDAVASGDSARCGGLADARLREICVRDVAVNTGNVALCDGITAALLKDSCYYKVAANKGNGFICDKIANAAIKEDCKKKV